MDTDNIVDTRFRRVKTNEVVTVAFIPLVESSAGAAQHLIIAGRSPKGAKVSAGTIALEGKDPVVREDHAVTDGQVVKNQGSIKAFLKCALPACGGAAAGCWVGGPGMIPCFCAWCGVSAAFCAALELVLP